MIVTTTIKAAQCFSENNGVSERAQLASIEVAEIIAMKSKSHTYAESVILTACKKMVRCWVKQLKNKLVKFRFQMIQYTGEF